MKKLILIFAVAVCFAFEGTERYRVVQNNVFSRGEKMTYRVHYSIFNAGEASFQVHDDIYNLNGRPCYKVTVFGKSVGAFKMMMKIRDTWGSYVDTSAMMSHRFYRDIYEGGWTLKEYVNFDHENQLAMVESHHKGKTENKKFEIKNNIQDIVSGMYFLRTKDLNKLESGDLINLNAFFEDTYYDFQVRYGGIEEVKTSFGKVKAHKINPVMPDNELFNEGNSISVWLSADKNKVPVKAEAKMLVGAVEIDINGFYGLKHPSVLDED